MSSFNFGGRVIPPTEFKVPVNKEVAKPDAYSEPESTETLEFDPQVLAYLIIRAIQLDESNLAQDLLSTQDTGTVSTPRLWEFQVCGNCSSIIRNYSLTFVVGCCSNCECIDYIPNSFRQQQNFMHLSSKLTYEFAEHLCIALERNYPK